MNNLEPQIALLDDVARINADTIRRIRDFVDAEELRKLATAHSDAIMRREVDLGFNAFALVSDVYYRENFHSDIIATILDPKGAHKQKDLYLRLFLEFLRDRHGIAINPDHYRHAQVKRESARIDVLIWDDIDHKAIIIESKINGAGDMDRQLSRYLDEVVNQRRLTCDAIIYLTLLQKKLPDMAGWPDKERKEVDAILHPVCAYQECHAQDDLYHGWLKACLEAGATDEVTFVVRQYRDLILKLGRNAMNLPVMEEFYELLKNPERHQAAQSLKGMVDDLPAFRCQRLSDAFRGRTLPFSVNTLYRPTLWLLQALPIESGSGVKIHVDTSSPGQTLISFWDQNDDSAVLPKRILTELELAAEFAEQVNGWDTKSFAYPAGEAELYDFLAMFFEKLRNYVTGVRSIS